MSGSDVFVLVAITESIAHRITPRRRRRLRRAREATPAPVRVRVRVPTFLSTVDRVISDVQKHDLVFLLIQKLEQDAIPVVNGKAPLIFELAVETMRIEPRVERIVPEDRDAFISKSLQLLVEAFVAAAIPGVEIDRHVAGATRAL